MKTDITEFYRTLSPAGRRVIAALIRRAPHMNRPFPSVIADLQAAAKCCKATVLRNLGKAGNRGLLHREVNPSGHRYGSLLTLHSIPCAEFIRLYKQKNGPAPDTEPDRYRLPENTAVDRYPVPEGNKTHETTAPALSRIDIDDAVDGLFIRLSDQGKRILTIISELCGQNPGSHVPLFIQHSAERAMCSEVTARRVISQGQQAGIFEKNMHPRGPRFGITIRPDSVRMARLRQLLAAFPPQPVTEAARYHPLVTAVDRNRERIATGPHTASDGYPATEPERTSIPPASKADAGSAQAYPGTPATGSERYKPGYILDREIKNLSRGQEEPEETRWARRLLAINADDFNVLWPRLRREGFGPDQIRQIVQHRMSYDETVLDIENSLHAVEHELEHGTFPKARKGICNYVFATLKTKGSWRRPQGFLTPNEQALANAEKEKQAVRKLKEAKQEQDRLEEKSREDAKFAQWLAAQSETQLAEIDRQCALPMNTDIARRSWRKGYWRRLN